MTTTTKEKTKIDDPTTIGVFKPTKDEPVLEGHFLRIYSIYDTISGEMGGKIAQGDHVVFLRLQVCPLRCPWCDSKDTWSKKGGADISFETICDQIMMKHCNKLIITGGEPLYQQGPALQKLIDWCGRNRITVQIETAGSILPQLNGVDCFVVDYKLKGSKQTNKMLPIHDYLRFGASAILKFVIADEDDFKQAIEVRQKIIDSKQSGGHPGHIPKFAFSPVTETLSPLQLLGWLRESKIMNYSLNIQLHKRIGAKEDDPTKKPKKKKKTVEKSK